ncbi:MAG: hypothetical protein H0U40_05395 [Chloroflexia bacterium]|nr:hypothetical protein [Chloroflexia bacterium]MDQ3512533.1 hypothetical protein [Chloroflexota bacterium]
MSEVITDVRPAPLDESRSDPIVEAPDPGVVAGANRDVDRLKSPAEFYDEITQRADVREILRRLTDS